MPRRRRFSGAGRGRDRADAPVEAAAEGRAEGAAEGADASSAVDAGATPAGDVAPSHVADARFLAVMSHEFRTPLTTVLGMVQMLETTPLDSEQRRALETAERSGRRLLSLIENILQYAALEAGRVRLEPAAFDVQDEIEAAADLMRLSAVEKGLRLKVDVDDALAAPRLGDGRWLRRAVANLLDNAVKFTSEGEVRLSARALEGEDVVITVSDTGIGVDETDAFAVFDADLTGTETRRYGGAGLGVAMARRIIELMGGTLEARNAETRGAVFEARLALARAPQTETAAAPVEEGPRASRRVLVAEDNATNQRLIKMIIEKLGHEVEVVENGALAVQAVEKGVYDIVVMDLHMPVMDGLTATRAIRALNDARADIPVIALTADVRPEVEARALEAGMNAFLEKPINVAKLAVALARFGETGGAVSPGA